MSQVEMASGSSPEGNREEETEYWSPGSTSRCTLLPEEGGSASTPGLRHLCLLSCTLPGSGVTTHTGANVAVLCLGHRSHTKARNE